MADIKDPENTILMELKDGTVIIELLPDIAPGHCERMKELARSGAYDNVCFHRVIDGFMAQSGDVQNGNMEKNFNLRMAGTGVGMGVRRRPGRSGPEQARAVGVQGGLSRPLTRPGARDSFRCPSLFFDLLLF